MPDTSLPTPDPDTMSPSPSPDPSPDGQQHAIPSPEPGTLVRTVKVGAAIAQAAIDAVEEFGLDVGTSVLRLGVLQLLELQQHDITAAGNDANLLAAYRNWIDVALRYYGPDGDATTRDYARTAALLSAEIQIAPPLPGRNGK